MKAVLISIQPKWCEKISSGEKTIEVRKTRPKIDTPFKCYIYATRPKKWFKFSSWGYASDENLWLSNGKVKMCDGLKFWANGDEYQCLNGKVIGEFICDKIDEYKYRLTTYEKTPYKGRYISKEELAKTCLSICEINNYLNGKNGYFWHISDLKIYDKPKVLRVFKKPCPHGEDMSCYLCEKSGYAPDMHLDCFNAVTRPPQSWCYVDESEVGQ